MIFLIKADWIKGQQIEDFEDPDEDHHLRRANGLELRSFLKEYVLSKTGTYLSTVLIVENPSKQCGTVLKLKKEGGYGQRSLEMWLN